ncbi:Type I restriction-modification system, specificity subunit S [Pseudomonas batumici]|uniref:Type I restriction-modification system, specificity subunit S n=1 Tax=Pseudomonas batumici TaxID=226910 RepID=A0A0C2I984_9PSED|nr:Type I restriction-modification system, specificity subunit S [Pseudomonas batumici]
MEWLGLVPEHWAVSPLKSVVTFRSGGTPSKDKLEFWDGDIPWASAKDLKKEQLEDTQDHLTELAVTSGAASLVPAGSVLVVVRGMILARIFPVSEAMVPMAINQDLKALHASSKLDGRFLAHLLRGLADESLRRLEEAGHGTKALRMEAWTSMQLTVPPSEEQCAILSHLDHETARIDALVEKKTRFIELLREKRQALITHAVTKGLDPSVKMKDSGVEWLGAVPEHWELKPLKYIGSAIIGLTYSPDDVVDETDGSLVLRSSNIQDGRLFLGDNVYVSTKIPNDLLTREGDILICSRNGSRALIGKNALIDKSAVGHSFGAFTTVFRSDANQFVYHVLNSALFKFQSGRFLTTTINQLTTETLNSFEIPLPPPDEQHRISDWLNNRLSSLDSLSARTEFSIKLLKERRAALITAAVTGQIDLREAV